MKKILGIVVLGLLLSGNAYASLFKTTWEIEKYRKIFDEKLKQKKYQQILLRPLVHRKLNKDLYYLAIKIAAKQPDIIRRAEELMKANK